jgi:hypothetical protein
VASDQPRELHRDANCPVCGREGVPVKSGRVGLHAPLRMGKGGIYVAKKETCTGLGCLPEYPHGGRRKAAA